VSQLKQKIEKEPGLYHFIQNDKVISTEKLEPPAPSGPTVIVPGNSLFFPSLDVHLITYRASIKILT
jgi:hypothetical protein